MKIIMLKGLPASGKTSWAKEQLKKGSYMRISKDDIRPMLGGYTPKREKEVAKIRNRLIEFGVEQKHNVIIDDTNLNPIHARTLAQLAKRLGAKFEINDSFMSVTPEECITRDLHRGEKAVGADVIWDMYYRWVAPIPAMKLSKNFDKPRCVIVDVDGTLALNTTGRNYYDMTMVDKDTPDPFMACVIDALHDYGRELSGEKYPRIIVVSGRNESARDKTEQWLDKNFIPFDDLYMRPNNDNRPDEVIKKEIYDNYIEPNYAVLGVFDDRPKCARLWRSLGLRVAQLGNPYLEF